MALAGWVVLSLVDLSAAWPCDPALIAGVLCCFVWLIGTCRLRDWLMSLRNRVTCTASLACCAQSDELSLVAMRLCDLAVSLVAWHWLAA